MLTVRLDIIPMVVEMQKMKVSCVVGMGNKIETARMPLQERHLDGVVDQAVNAVFVKITFVTVTRIVMVVKMKARFVANNIYIKLICL